MHRHTGGVFIYLDTWWDTFGGVISPSQRPLPTQDSTTQRDDKHPCLKRNSNPRSQQPSDQSLRIRQRGHWDRPHLKLQDLNPIQFGPYKRNLHLNLQGLSACWLFRQYDQSNRQSQKTFCSHSPNRTHLQNIGRKASSKTATLETKTEMGLQRKHKGNRCLREIEPLYNSEN
jgi:hypothetical protein